MIDDARSRTRVEEALELAQEAARREVRRDRSTCRSASASIPSTPTRWCAAPSCCPHGIGKTVRVAVFAKGEKEREAREAGADVVGAEDLVERDAGRLDGLRHAIATPDLMGQVGRLGKVLGPRGLMPNPKLGTVTFDVARAVREAKAGKVEFRVDKAGNVHTPVGKQSFQRAASARQRDGADRGDRAGEAGGGQGQVPPVADGVVARWGPGCPVDAQRVANLFKKARLGGAQVPTASESRRRVEELKSGWDGARPRAHRVPRPDRAAARRTSASSSRRCRPSTRS